MIVARVPHVDDDEMNIIIGSKRKSDGEM